MPSTRNRPKTSQRQIDPELSQFSENISPLLQRIYLGRGISNDDQLERTLAKLPRPDSLQGLSEGVRLLEEALTEQQSVLIVGDFDADGATSTALTMLALRAMGMQHMDFIVPNRFEFGYGLTPEIVALAQQRNPDLIITVDNGISSVSGVKAAKNAGIKVLITDHHLPGAVLPVQWPTWSHWTKPIGC